ncbi:MAG: amino acid ABC transporter permease [Oscillospiraceae bacterium]|jgi:putative glutamine transport system permease protein|nr:amino acid ABC transporter permease [Oscillospiraceae bacterium]
MLTKVFEDIFTSGNIKYLFIGLGYTILAAVVTVFVALVLGTILALARNYEKRVLGRIAAVYVEIFRNTPLLLWIFVCVFMLPKRIFGDAYIRGVIALTLYTSSVLAEIVRGGLNSIAAGQFEAARSQGFNFVQTIVYIALPQCFRRIIPSLMSQIVTTVKDTSFLAQVAIGEFFYRSKIILGQLPKHTSVTTAHVFTLYLFVALIYFAINFTLSTLVRRYQSKQHHV